MRLVILLALLLALAPAHSSDACKVVFSSEIVSIFSIGIIISLLLVSLWYMIGMLIESPDIEATMKVELQQIGLTFLIAIITSSCIYLFCAINITPDGLELGAKDSLIASVDKSLLAAAQATLRAYLDMSNKMFDYAKVGSIYGGVSSYGVSLTFSPYAIYSTVAQSISPMAHMTLIAYFSLVFQYSLFRMAQSSVFLYLLPIGLTLRAFPMFRKFGGVLVAVCLGMSFIYPLIIAVGFAMIDKVPEQIYKSQGGINPSLFTYPTSALLLATSYSTSAVTLPFEIAMAATALSAALIYNLNPATQLIGLDLAISADVLPHLRYAYASFATIIILAFFLPILEVMIVSAIVRSLSGAIGAETDISGIMRAI
ncbi:MAG: hypothetical protein N3G76_02675 [Candidatus Micrarchaeota archaeon]|nr:hypothetical protein [Candidatus Micrarchaeota archaeon]